MFNYGHIRGTDMAGARKSQKKARIAGIKIYLNGQVIPLSEASKRIEIPLTKTSKELLSALVEAEEPVSPKQLASELKRTQTTIYRSIKNLEGRRLVLKIRRGLVALTEEGYETVKKQGKKR
jgi:DNA-binding MarR family transcriptional regulator